MRPFPIYPLYKQTVILSLDKPIADCFLFRPRKRLEKRRKRSHTNVSNALVTRTSRLSQTLLQTPLPCFHASINEYYTAKNGLGTIAPRLLSQVKVGTHSPLPTGSHTADHRAKQGRFGRGVVSLPSERFARFGNPARPGIRTANFAVFWPWSGALPKSAESLRNSDALMRVAVPRRRGPAGLRDPIAVSLAALMGFTVLADRDYRVRKKAHFVFMRRAVLPALPAPSAALLYALMH